MPGTSLQEEEEAGRSLSLLLTVSPIPPMLSAVLRASCSMFHGPADFDSVECMTQGDILRQGLQ